MIDITYN